MIYLDNAATTLQKPAAVHRAVDEAMRSAAAAGRSGHRPAMHAGELIFTCREAVARLRARRVHDERDARAQSRDSRAV